MKYAVRVTRDLYVDCMENGLYFIFDPTSWFARFLPVLDIPEDPFLRGLDIFETALKKVQERYGSD